MNIFLKECKTYLLPFLIWTASLITIYIVASVEFDAFQGNEEIAEAMAQFEQLFLALGSSPQNMTTPEGFLGIMAIYIYLPLGIYSGLLGSSIISKEEKDKTAEFLFSLPVSRTKVITSKLLTAVLFSALLAFSITVGNILVFMRFEPTSGFYSFVWNMGLGVFLTQMIFLSLGVALSSVLKYYKKSGSITVIVLISSFMLNILIGFVEELEFLMIISPFDYYSIENMTEGVFELQYILITLLIVTAGIFTLYRFYPKRDLYI
jgi:ABC-2 type transport system permease protein